MEAHLEALYDPILTVPSALTCISVPSSFSRFERCVPLYKEHWNLLLLFIVCSPVMEAPFPIGYISFVSQRGESSGKSTNVNGQKDMSFITEKEVGNWASHALYHKPKWRKWSPHLLHVLWLKDSIKILSQDNVLSYCFHREDKSVEKARKTLSKLLGWFWTSLDPSKILGSDGFIWQSLQNCIAFLRQASFHARKEKRKNPSPHIEWKGTMYTKL